MNFKEKLKRLRDARESNRLVIFVGAGVSNNSGIPSWHELIKHFAEKLDIDKCSKCNFRNSANCIPDCEEKYNFCQDDYLKIPQYFYNKKKADYLNTIKEVFSINAKPNKINDMIMELQPKHIITTNFDKLIENTENPNNMIYKVVIKDEDLLNNQSNNNYIIKMHGDIYELEDIVLKEEDYLNYSQKHILIETFIKSLLVDHIFLFIGYSLNDYNLKLIISWLEYLARGAKRQGNFIHIERKEKYIDRYFSKNNIITISASEIPNSIKKRYTNIMPKKIGASTCALLECISDARNDYLFESPLDVVYGRYQIFKDRKRISYEELKQYHSFGPLELKGSEIKLYNKSEFNSLKKILKDKSEKAEFIKKILLKTGIEVISNDNDSIEVKVPGYKDEYRELLKLEQQNRYNDALLKAKAINDEMARSYYLYLIGTSREEFSKLMEKINSELSGSNDYFKLIIFKFNDCGLLNTESLRSECFREIKKILKNIPSRNRISYRYFENIFKGSYKNIIKCNKLADNCINLYTDIQTTHYGEFKNDELMKLQATSYDYYYYFKINRLMIDHFPYTKEVLEPYIKSMLCTYFPQEEKISIFFGLKSNPPKKYFLNSIDLDIIVKYSNFKKLKSLFRDYRVEELRFEKNIRINKVLKNLCKNVIEFPKGILASYLNTFLFILANCNSEYFDINEVADSISELLSSKDLLSKNILSKIFEGMKYFFETYVDVIEKSLLKKILKSFLNIETIDYCAKRHLYLEVFFKLFLKHSIDKISKNVEQLINEKNELKEKIRMIHLLHPLFNGEQKNNYSTFLKYNIEVIPVNHLYDYILKDYLKYDRGVEKKYLQFLNEEINKRKKKPGVRTIPDYLLRTIDDLMILFLSGKIKSLNKFKCFSGYSKHLSFIIDPENYDISKVESLDYMWENFLRIKKYRNIMIKKGLSIKEYLEKTVKNGRATESQKLLLYKYFLSDEETYKYMQL